MSETNTSPIIAKVCKHVNQTFSKFEKFDDLTAVKLTNIHEDQTRSESYLLIKNYQKPFWIVKPNHRKFKQQKDYIEATKCKQFKSNAAKLAYTISKVLYGNPDPKANLRMMTNDPNVFGCDQTVPVFIKQLYFDKNEECQQAERFTVAAYDVETEMDTPNEPVMMASVTFGKKAYHASVRSWWDGLTDEEIIKGLKEEEHKRFEEEIKTRQCVIEYELFDTPGQVAEACINRFHMWSPDLVASWNATYDMEKNEQSLVNDRYDLARVYSDPSIPDEFTSYELNKGRTHKVKEDGSKSPLEPQEKFPTLRTIAKWQWLDFMSFYAIKRTAGGKLDGYGLNDCAAREGVPGKLYTEEGSHLIEGKADWHRYMQNNHKFLYCMYNIKDNWVIEDLNNKTLDLSMTFPLLIKSSEYFNYPSQPKIISDALSFVARDNGYVWGCAGSGGKNDLAALLPTLGNWIALLQTEKNADKGYRLFTGLADVFSNGRSSVSDVDVEGAYPTATLTANVSNFTTQIEMCKMQGKDPTKQREISINYASSPEANAVSLCEDLYNFPGLDNVQEVFESILKENNALDQFLALGGSEEVIELEEIA